MEEETRASGMARVLARATRRGAPCATCGRVVVTHGRRPDNGRECPLQEPLNLLSIAHQPISVEVAFALEDSQFHEYAIDQIITQVIFSVLAAPGAPSVGV
jgi:hypothetical protein